MMAGHDEPAPAGARQALPAVLPPDLNLFLFAGVGVERNGMTLTVLSALARLDLDPWDEAGRLSRLSRAQAADKFAGRLAMLPAMPGWPQETTAETTAETAAGTAARLVALLPQNGRLRPAPEEPATETLRALRRRAALRALLVVAVMLALAAIGHWAAADIGAAAPQDSLEVPTNAPATARTDSIRSPGSMTSGAGGRWPR